MRGNRKNVNTFILYLLIIFQLCTLCNLYLLNRRIMKLTGIVETIESKTTILESEVYEIEIKIDKIDQVKQIEETEVKVEEPEYTLTDVEINMIAQLTMAEANNQEELGKRLVIDTVLNRLDSDRYPNTVREVIYQKNQFAPIWDGNFENCYPSEENINLVKEELTNRTDSEVIFFRTKRYSDYGTPKFKVGDHYFSKL